VCVLWESQELWSLLHFLDDREFADPEQFLSRLKALDSGVRHGVLVACAHPAVNGPC
jgi:hypothetical protein